MKAQLQTFAVLISLAMFLNCGRSSEQKKPQEQDAPDTNNFNLVPGSDAFLKFNCTIKGETAGRSDASELSKMFTPVPSCPTLGLRQVGSAFATNIIKMAVDADQSFYLLMESFDTGDSQKLYGNFSFIKMNSSGQQLFEIKVNENTVVESFALHPSGEVTIVETRKEGSDDFDGYRVWFRRIDKNGNLKSEVQLKDHDIPNTDNGSPRVPYYAGVILLADGEGVYLTAETDKGKVYSLTSDYQIKWSHQCLPTHRLLVVPGRAKMFIDKEGRLLLGQTVYEKDLSTLEGLFGESFPEKNGILIYRFSLDGKKIEHKVITNNNSIYIAGLYSDGNTVTIGGDTRIKKFDNPNHSYERDLFFTRFDISTGSVLANKAIDLQRDDSAADFVVDNEGNGIFVGRNNYIQVDSHSVVEYGQAYLLKVDTAGDVRSYLSFNGSRNTGLGNLIVDRTREVAFFSGIFDSPITHTGDNNQSLKHQNAMIGTLRSY